MTKGEPETLSGTLGDLFPRVELVPDLSNVISKPSPRVLKAMGKILVLHTNVNDDSVLNVTSTPYKYEYFKFYLQSTVLCFIRK